MLRNLNEKIVNLEKWDTSNIESMSKTFLQAKKFNTDISSWKTNSVKDMSNMFTSAEAFSQNLDKWDTSNVTTMNRMFQEAKAFNGDISRDTKNVVIWYMFSGQRHLTKTYQAKCWNVSTMEKAN
nr:BspA family leucine-rich repeat surface protein [Mycoplasmopsis bovis]